MVHYSPFVHRSLPLTLCLEKKLIVILNGYGTFKFCLFEKTVSQQYGRDMLEPSV